MKNIFFLLITLTAFSMWVAAKTPFPEQQSAGATIQTGPFLATSLQQKDPATGPDPTGVTTIDQTENSFISIYPNPATSYLNVKITSTVENKIEVSLYDITGKLLKAVVETPAGEKMVRITRDNLPAGVYFLVVKTSEGEQCRKVIFS